MNFGLLFWILIFGFCIRANARDWSQQGPFEVRTQNPVYLQTVNLDPTRAVPLAPGMLELRVDSAYSNLYEYDFTGTNEEKLDMELWRINYNATYGFYPGFEGGIQIPIMQFNGGFLDGFVQDFHHAFGFPNGGRQYVPNGSFSYRVTQNGKVLYNVVQQSMSLGDISLFLKHQVIEETDMVPAMAWRFLFKVPSGDAASGMGSGSPGFGFGLALEKSSPRWHGYLNVNYLVDAGNSKLQDLMNTNIFNFAVTGELSLSRRVSALMELVGGTPWLRGMGFGTWDNMPLDFTFGVRGDQPWGGVARPFFWEAGFTEDVINYSPSVDFTAWISVGLRFPVKSGEFYQGDFFASRSHH